ncbi:MFS general substrate transporter [Dendrothele bispora CBS 962.96]|uniref:MFS general substrate transporter n=1 Tax=Dendrothele bispora (strain CBS 962.96) TaxID=1314807 RepID=A0A4S8MDK8_DENBC|nr:MFS general substrate transporter [Dendrothele bispora CBS 962.96]
MTTVISAQELDTSESATVRPAGTTKAWLTVVGCFLIQFSTVASVNSFGVLQDFYVHEFLPNSSASKVSWIIGFEILLQLSLGALAGKLCDMGHTKAILLIGTLVYLFCFFMLSLARSGQYYQVFLSQGFGMGIGVGLCYVPTLVTAANHFPRRHAIAMGIVSSSGPLGGVVFSITLNNLIPSVGFPWAVRAVAFLALGLLAIGNLLITAPSRPEQAAVIGKTSLLHGPYLWTVASGTLLQLGGLFPLFYIQLFASSHNLSRSFIFYSVAIMSFCIALGRVIPTYFAGKYGVVGTLIIFEALQTGIVFIMFGANRPAGLVIFAVLPRYGLIFGGVTSLFFPTITALVPSQVDRGKFVGVAMFPAAISSLIGSPVAGAIIGSNLDWWKGIVFSGVILGATTVLQAIARYLHQRTLRV